jgi:hypothetical protein
MLWLFEKEENMPTIPIPPPLVGANAIPDECQFLAQKIANVKAELEQDQSDLREPGLPEIVKRALQREITRLSAELSQLQAQFRQCQQDNLPNLVADTFQLRLDNAAKQLWVALIVANSGNAPCSQNFKVTIGVDIANDNGDVYSEGNVDVQGPIAAGGQVVTPSVVVPLEFRDQPPHAVYTFYGLVDPEYAVAETTKSDNSTQVRWWTISPGAARQTTPLVLDFSKKLKPPK